jgi:hypothetical protein
MSHFKLGLVIGFGLGWLVATGRAAQLVDDLRERFLDTSGSTTSASDANGVYDFAVRAAQ